ncbi:MAG TPA: hypothetical protein VFW73_12915 [Lacipirellulaceae bacterium]|nr:hypothetical protein [Lacipirellulaceae bacterium]
MAVVSDVAVLPSAADDEAAGTLAFAVEDAGSAVDPAPFAELESFALALMGAVDVAGCSLADGDDFP